MRYRCVTLLVGQVLDAMTFAAVALLVPSSVILSVERNPLTATILMAGGMAGVLLFKLMLPTLVLWMALWLRAGSKSRLASTLALVAGYSGFIGAAFNAYALGQLL